MTGSSGAEVRRAEMTLHGHRTAYRWAGDPGMPALVLVHGLTSSSATWAPVIADLGTRAHVIAPDLLGHGDSDKPRGDYSLGAFATGIRDLLEQLGHSRATIVGHSLGGGIALQFAYQFPAHTERLGLVASGGLGREVSWVLRAASLPGAELVLPVVAHRRIAAAAAAAARFLQWSPVQPSPSVREAARGYASLADLPARTAFVHTVRSVIDPRGQRVSAGDRLYLSNGRPTLIVWGALDGIIPVSHAYAAHEAIVGSRLEVFEQSRHFPHRDEPERFARVVLDFLSGTEPTVVERRVLRDGLVRGSVADDPPLPRTDDV